MPSVGDREKHFAFEATACEVASVSLLLRCSVTILERSSGKVQASSPISVLEVAGEAVLEVFALGSAPVRAGLARSLRRDSRRHLPEVREDLRDDAPLGDDRDDPHRRAARAEERIDLVEAADQRGVGSSEAVCARLCRARRQPRYRRRPPGARRQPCRELHAHRFRRHHIRPRPWTPRPRPLSAVVWPSRPRRSSRSSGSNACAAPATA